MIEITQLASSAGPLTKRIHLSPDGKLISDGSACVMARGEATRLHLDGIGAFAKHIANLDTNQAIALGALRPDLPDAVRITTHGYLSKLNGSAPPDLISRTAGHIAYREAAAALALIDIDTKGMPSSVQNLIKDAGGYWCEIARNTDPLRAVFASNPDPSALCVSIPPFGRIWPGRGLGDDVRGRDRRYPARLFRAAPAD